MAEEEITASSDLIGKLKSGALKDAEVVVLTLPAQLRPADIASIDWKSGKVAGCDGEAYSLRDCTPARSLRLLVGDDASYADVAAIKSATVAWMPAVSAVNDRESQIARLKKSAQRPCASVGQFKHKFMPYGSQSGSGHRQKSHPKSHHQSERDQKSHSENDRVGKNKNHGRTDDQDVSSDDKDHKKKKRKT